MKKIFKKTPGITLIELLTVIGIISILTAVAVPSVNYFLPGIQLNGSARVLSANLREAQERTITEQKQYLIRFFPNASPIYYEMIRVNGGIEEPAIKKINLAHSETVNFTGITNNQITFSTDGGPSSNGTITLGLNSANKNIDITPSGFIKIQ